MRVWAVILIAAFIAPAGADILHLRSGERLYGTIVSENERQVVFRVWLTEGSSAVRTFAVAQVARLERTSVDAPPPTAQRAPGDESPDERATAEDFPQMIREAFELLDDGDSPAALKALQRVVVRAPETDLPKLSEQVRAARGVGLDELLAQTRVAALAKVENGLLVKYATPYEARALSLLLENRQIEALGRVFDGRSVARWTKKADEYKELKPDTRELVEAARVAAGAIGGRLKYDGRLRVDREEREKLAALRADLARFVAKVTALKGYTARYGDNTRDEAADRALVEEAERAAQQKSDSTHSTQDPASEEQP